MTDQNTPRPASESAQTEAFEHAVQPTAQTAAMGQPAVEQGQPAPAAGRAPQSGAPASAAPGGELGQQTDTARLGSRAVSITATVLGACVLLFSGASAAYGAVRGSMAGDGEAGFSAVSAGGVTSIGIDHGFGQLDVQFEGEGRDATLQTHGMIAERLTLERDGKSLVVRTDDHGASFGGWGWLFGQDGDQWAILTLPESLEGVDLDIDSGAGSVYVDGAFGDVDIDTGAGEVQVTGSADSARAEVSAGQVVFDLRDVQTVSTEVSAGNFSGSFSGDAPRELTLDVSAGGADVILPDEAYDLRQDVSAGSVDTEGLRIDSSSTHRIDVRLSAGEVTLTSEGGGEAF